MSQELYPVVVKVLKKDETHGVKIEDGFMPDYAPKFVAAASATQARELVLVELVKAEAYDPADPMVAIEVCCPFTRVNAAAQ